MSIIEFSNLTFAYPGSYDNVFENLSLRLDTEWRLGLIGRNGRGKTTLLRLMDGEFEGQYSGSITAPPGIRRFPFPAISQTAITIDAVVEAANRDLEEWRLRREMGLLGLDADDLLSRPFGTLSGGEQTKAMLAALFAIEGGFLLIDEPTNHLDLEGRETAAEYLRTKSGFVLVSHDRAFIDGAVDHIASLNKADVEVVRGNYSSWRKNKDRRDAYELGQNERLKKDIRRLDDSTRRATRWSDKVESSKIGTHAFDRGAVGAQAARMMKKAKAIEKRRESAADEKRMLLKNFEEIDSLKLQPLTFPQKLLVGAEGLSLFYDGKMVTENITFDIERGDRVAIVGANGTGKSTLLNLVCGDDVEHSGTLRRGSNLIVSYVPQNASFLQGGIKDYAREQGVDESLFLAILRKLGFERVQFEKDMSDYSAGQKKKVLLARSLCEHAHLYIWDEPLNYIDLPSREQIEQLIVAFEPTLLVVEHDRAFLENVATAYLEL